jgi:hypothetical protein
MWTFDADQVGTKLSLLSYGCAMPLSESFFNNKIKILVTDSL